MPRARSSPALDRELAGLPPAERWHLWMRRIEAVLFASAAPVPRADLVRVVGRDAPVDLLVADLAADLADRPVEVTKAGTGWMLRTRPAYAPAIRAAAAGDGQAQGLSEVEAAVLAAVARHQPITRDGLRDIFGREINRDLLARLRARELIATGPRAPRRGAPHSFVTTERFLVVFGLESLRDLPDPAPGADTG